MFESILIANRGEIACRIIKTAKSLGLGTVAIYSTVDRNSLHVQLADTAVCVGEAKSSESYLNIDSIVSAAKSRGAGAVHPGYGFLSENAEFAKACAKAGLIFIGPPVAAMQAMASKQESKQLLEKKGIPLIPGYHGKDQSENELLKAAQKIGFPVLIKAANGGGGKGMRAVHEACDFKESLASAKRESLSSFGDDTMIIEKLLINPRHIEVQIMADQKGQVVHLFERDCSIQRRHQKIIEEAPAAKLPTKAANNLGKTACEVARSIDYVGAGTVEFLVDALGDFYFMEMNTRLQVEHPVTEMITGLDLVAWQIAIAKGESLPLSQEAISKTGHAIECRIYAEDPYRDFLPATGVVDFLHTPEGPGLRIDSGIQLGSEILPYYDPMVAKLIAHGANRKEALQRLRQALKQFHLGKVKTNLPFLRAICEHPEFQKGDFGTDFLTNYQLTLASAQHPKAILWAAGYEYIRLLERTKADPLSKATFAFQNPSWILRLNEAEEVIELTITTIDAASCRVDWAGKSTNLWVLLQQDHLQISIEGVQQSIWVQEEKNVLTFYSEEGVFSLTKFQPGTKVQDHHKSPGQLTAPMPATVVALLKTVGDKVRLGDKLLVLEAMKMEHTICAPRDGLVSDIFYKVGDQVLEGVELAALIPDE